MAEVRGYFKPDFSDSMHILRDPDDDEDEIKTSGFFVYHDIHELNLIVGLSKGEYIGADIYKKSGVSRDPHEAFTSIPDVIEPDNLIGTIKPFFRSEPIRLNLDDGETGVLSIVHLPLIRIHPVSLFD